MRRFPQGHKVLLLLVPCVFGCSLFGRGLVNTNPNSPENIEASTKRQQGAIKALDYLLDLQRPESWVLEDHWKAIRESDDCERINKNGEEVINTAHGQMTTAEARAQCDKNLQEKFVDGVSFDHCVAQEMLVEQVSLGGGTWSDAQAMVLKGKILRTCDPERDKDTMTDDLASVVDRVRDTCPEEMRDFITSSTKYGNWKVITEPNKPPKRSVSTWCWGRKTSTGEQMRSYAHVSTTGQTMGYSLAERYDQ